MTRAERAEILRLVEEGSQIAQIARRFRHLDYADVYWAARGEGQRSALGTKRMISNRLISL